MDQRATQTKMMMMYKHALLLYTIFNVSIITNDWMDLNFQQNKNERNNFWIVLLLALHSCLSFQVTFLGGPVLAVNGMMINTGHSGFTHWYLCFFSGLVLPLGVSTSG